MSLGIWATMPLYDERGLKFSDCEVFDMSPTYNLSPMWELAGIKNVLYECDGKMLEVIRDDVRKAVALMKDNPEQFKELNPTNGWGSYESNLEFLESLLMACEKFPYAIIGLSR